MNQTIERRWTARPGREKKKQDRNLPTSLRHSDETEISKAKACARKQRTPFGLPGIEDDGR
jgi:hypothetical protein